MVDPPHLKRAGREQLHPGGEPKSDAVPVLWNDGINSGRPKATCNNVMHMLHVYCVEAARAHRSSRKSARNSPRAAVLVDAHHLWLILAPL